MEAEAAFLNMSLKVCLHKHFLRVSVKRVPNPLPTHPQHPDLLNQSVEFSLEIHVSVNLSDDTKFNQSLSNKLLKITCGFKKVSSRLNDGKNK